MTRKYRQGEELVLKFKDLDTGAAFSHNGRILLKVPPKRGFNAVNILSSYPTPEDVFVKVKAGELIIPMDRVEFYQHPDAGLAFIEKYKSKKGK